jgi:phosphoribosylanthranilate isomerase
MWIKICANTNLEDAQAALDLGADAVGFVFAPSSRRVTPEQVGAITARLAGGGERIGVFHETDFAAIEPAVRVAGLSGVQLHGGVTPHLAARLREAFGDGLTIIQTLHWSVDGGGETAADLAERVAGLRGEGVVDRVLVDSKVGAALGGTGRAFDWEQAQGLFGGTGGMRMIVAGGLGPGNVGEAIARLQPWGVDVASGVEAGPGRKDRERLRQFIECARAAGETC